MRIRPRNPRLFRHLGYAILIACLAVLVGYKGVLPVFRSHLMTYLGIGDAGFGMLFSVGAIASLFSVLFGGALIDRWGPRRVIRLGLVGVSGAMFIVALGGREYWAFVAAVAVSGVFSAPLFIAITAYLARLFPRHQRRIISLNLASTSAGGMMFPLVAEGLLAIAQHSPAIRFDQVLHLPFILVGTLLLGANVIYRPKSHGSAPVPRPASRKSRWHWHQLVLPRRALALAALIAVHGVSDGTLYLWMSRFLESGSFKSAIIAPGVVLSGYAMAYLLSRLILGTLSDQVGRRAFLVLPGLLGGGIMIGGIVSRQYELAAAGYVAGAFCWSFEYPTFVSALLRHDRKRFGSVMAVAGVMSSLMSFAVMNGMGLLISHIGDGEMWKAMCIPASGFLIVGLGGLIWSWRYESDITTGAPEIPTPMPVAIKSNSPISSISRSQE